MVNPYLSWEELDDGVEAAQACAAVAVEPAPNPTNERLSELAAERARIERRLMELLGKAPPSGEKARDAARFPMPIHTAESRLEDRRVARAEEQARAAARRAMERNRIAAQEVAERAEAKKEHERTLIQAQAQRRKDASARQERRGAWLRALHVQEAMHERWAEQRSAALKAGSQSRRQGGVLFEQRSQSARERALSRLHERREEEAAFASRLDQRSQRKSSADASDGGRRRVRREDF